MRGNGDIQGLTETLNKTSSLPCVQLQLLEDKNFYLVSTSVLVSNNLLVLGNSKAIEIGGSLTAFETAYVSGCPNVG